MKTEASEESNKAELPKILPESELSPIELHSFPLTTSSTEEDEEEEGPDPDPLEKRVRPFSFILAFSSVHLSTSPDMIPLLHKYLPLRSLTKLTTIYIYIYL